MEKSADTIRATREAAQPSLWDRLTNDLPGLQSEISALEAAAAAATGAERAAALVAGGPRAIEAEAALGPEEKRRLLRLAALGRRRAELELRGIVVSADVLREAVRRDIQALFNTERFEARPLLTDREAEIAGNDPPSLADFPEIRRSVVNYGVPPFAGRSARDFDRETLAREIRAVLAVFEPRLRESATRVVVAPGDRSAGLSIEIDALLIMAPAPERLRLRTMIDLDSGRAETRLADA
jgi:type VI secretion system protein ImpF